jgi:hypothetical protein
MVSKNDAGYWILDKKLTFICVIPHPASSIMSSRKVIWGSRKL